MVFDFLKRTPVVDIPEKKASATGRVVAWGSSGRVAWSPRDAVSLSKTGFQGNPMGFRAVKLIAEAARLTKPGGRIVFTDWMEGPAGLGMAEAERMLGFMKFPSVTMFLVGEKSQLL